MNPRTSGLDRWWFAGIRAGHDGEPRLRLRGSSDVTAAQQIGAGEVQAAIAGGMENMDRAPYLMDGGRWGYRMGPAEIHDIMLRDGLDDAFSGKHSGWHTEDLVPKAQLTREVQDGFAARSQQRFNTAQRAGKFGGDRRGRGSRQEGR